MCPNRFGMGGRHAYPTDCSFRGGSPWDVDAVVFIDIQISAEG
jgi:hypothetical protein